MKQESDAIYHPGYYRRAVLLRRVRYALLVLLLLFLLVTFFAFREELTVDHFRYLLRNFEFGPHSAASVGDTIYYSADADSTFGLVSGGLACLTDTRIFVTDGRSGRTLSEYHGFSTPRALFSDRYMLVYDRTGSTLAFYNAFDRLKSLTFEGNLLDAALAENGTFAVAVAEKESYYSTVYVYDRNLRQRNKLSKYKYVRELALTSDGKTLAVASVFANDKGILTSEVQLLTVGTREALATLTVEGSAVLSLSFFEGGNLAVLFEDRLLFLDEKGGEKKTVNFDRTPAHVYFDAAGVLLIRSAPDSRQEFADCYNTAGEPVLSGYPLSGRCRAALGDGRLFYLLTDDSLYGFDRKKETVSCLSVEGTGRTLVSDGRSLYLTGPSSARRLDPESWEKRKWDEVP